ncbi:HAMP domain-containing histidine kinase [Microvirga sp. STR05]|uniref:histidine kinase n=1 Tax=Hymenobacter duratus TaxID=2771356 RepID=A0ABR8JCC1_9BACT|nr:HAMP domain-containing sensor histidine kinase [Hymenobacter duratus]MBD2714338.1 HAMP domain-containing histidine kinase [Hymenobacter duratus]MBR7949241.1 HAMP domain-containing histidine kinase [Microvirga sp. STR05]
MLIRNKLMLRFTLLVLAIQVSFSAFIYYFYATTRRQRFEHRLENAATLSGRLLVRTGKLATGNLGSIRRGDLITIPGEQISIYGPAADLRYSSSDDIDQAPNQLRLNRLKPRQPLLFTIGLNREAIGMAYEYQGKYYHIFVSAVDRLGWAQLNRVRILLLVGNVGALALTILAGWYFAGSALRPVARIIRQAERISASNLGRRLHEGNRRDEMAQLAMTFNVMLTGLEQAFESQRSFLSHASHELRTPLTTLMGTLETALTYDQTLEDARQSMTESLDAARHLHGLTNSLLALVKVDGALPAFVPVRLDECLSQALDYARAKYPGRELRLVFGELPEAEETDVFMVPGNAQLLTTALLNLLDNACKYSAGAVQAELAYDAAHTLRVRITDTGPGLTPEELKRIYEPLYRTSGAINRPGYGLGLPLTQKIVQRHGGRLELRSAVGQGTTATVWLPALTKQGLI